MRVTQHHIISRLKSRTVMVGGALFMALLISGCSAANMTGFSFPVFGLTKKSGNEGDVMTTSSIPTDENQSGAQPERLTVQ
jgi:hypothetical protein